MHPFKTYHLFKESFEHHTRVLVPIIVNAAAPDMILLLGGSAWSRRTQSIFYPNGPLSQFTSGYFFLVLKNDTGTKELHEWQDKIEQHCKCLMPITVIVLPFNNFTEWLRSGHRFAATTVRFGVRVYDPENLFATFPECYETKPGDEQVLKEFKHGMNKAQEFFAGAELFYLRKENALAAFMLHQAVEQSLSSLLKMKTGFEADTHSILRLYRYCSFVAYQLSDIFSAQSERHQQLFTLLQKAYVAPRYDPNYKICVDDLLALMQKVKDIMEVVCREKIE
ncbi:MAG: hypothetical protein JWN76_2847 [Chitinophagaceae bacterium]|nr:hypothetical protein [Chitinophagaceae bacterium]